MSQAIHPIRQMRSKVSHAPDELLVFSKGVARAEVGRNSIPYKERYMENVTSIKRTCHPMLTGYYN
jgi:hypothetical protein